MRSVLLLSLLPLCTLVVSQFDGEVYSSCDFKDGLGMQYYGSDPKDQPLCKQPTLAVFCQCSNKKPDSAAGKETTNTCNFQDGNGEKEYFSPRKENVALCEREISIKYCTCAENIIIKPGEETPSQLKSAEKESKLPESLPAEDEGDLTSYLNSVMAGTSGDGLGATVVLVDAASLDMAPKIGIFMNSGGTPMTAPDVTPSVDTSPNDVPGIKDLLFTDLASKKLRLRRRGTKRFVAPSVAQLRFPKLILHSRARSS